MTQDVGSSFELAYREVLAMARARLARESAPISTGTLAHELYLNLRDRADLRFENREHFLGYASKAMRSLLVDMARERMAQKRFAELVPLTLGEDVADAQAGTPERILALEQALERLGGIDPRLLQVGEMRVLMGMEVAQIAATLKISEPTVKRDWQKVKAYLHDALEGPG